MTFGLYLDLSIEWNAAAFYNFPFILISEGTENVKITGTGAIEGEKGNDSRGEMTMQLVGLFRAKNYEISNITLRKYHAYCLKAVSSMNGLYKNITIDNSEGTVGGTDGINLTSCKNIRVTACNLNTGDDGIYIGQSYNDPRDTDLWYNLSNPLTPSNIEIDNNHCNVIWDETKAFCFIMWGEEIPDQRLADVNNIYIHDNYFETAGAWTGHWNGETGKFEYSGKCNPMKNIRFENNTFGSIQGSFYTLPISDLVSVGNKLADGTPINFDSMKSMGNTDFSRYDVYWVSRKGGSAGEKDGYGYIDNLDKRDSALYQGINFTADTDYKFTANVKSSGDPVRLFVKDQITGELIASKEFTNTDWQTVELEFSVPKTGDYHIGIERGNATKGYGYIDDASCVIFNGIPDDAAGEPVGDTIHTDQIPDYIGDGGGWRNAYGTKFGTTKAGKITKVRLYTTANESGEHLVSIWNYDTNTMLTEQVYSWNISIGYEGWREFTLPTPISIVPGTAYVVSVTAGPDCLYAADLDLFAEPMSNGCLYTFENSGLSSSNAYAATYAMPDSPTPASVFRDVEFIPDEDVEFIPDDAAGEPIGDTLFTEQVPNTVLDGGGWRNAYGTKFGTTTTGKITKVRIYTAENEGGEHLVSIWNYDTKTMLTEQVYTWNIVAGYEGWREFTLPTPVTIVPNITYVVSVTAGEDCIYVAEIDGLKNSISSEYLYTIENGGLYSSNAYAATYAMPDAQSTANLFRDVEFIPLEGEFDVKVTDYGAKGDGITNDRAAIQAAIDTANAVGGGTVRLDAGKTFLSSNLRLRSNVNFVLEEGSMLKQTGNVDEFVNPLKNYEPFELTLGQYLDLSIEWNAAAFYNFPFIYAPEGTNNFKITGTGTIEMEAGDNPDYPITMQVLGLFKADNFELSDFTIQKYHAFCVAITNSSNGLVKNLTIDITGGTIGGTDGISITSSKNLRITGCDLYTGDDSLYMGCTYNDPRSTNLWYNCDDPYPNENIEIDNNHCEVAWDETKAFCFIMWGEEFPDQKQVEVNNIYVHDNYFETMGGWTGHWNKETGKFEYSGKCNPMKNIRFENNTIGSIQSSFYTLPISDLISVNNKYENGQTVEFDCMTEMRNTDFAKKDTYWVSREGGSSGWNEAGYGYIDNLDKADAALYQGIKLTGGNNYKFTAKVKSSGDPVRLFVKNQKTGELIASKEFTNTDWKTVQLEFSIPTTGNYRLGIERGNAVKGYGYIDDASCIIFNGIPDDAASTPVGNTIHTTQIPDFYSGNVGWRNAYGTKFGTTVPGKITKVRLYTAAQESGEHLVSIWNYDTNTLISKQIYTWDISLGYEGWREFTLPTPVSIVPGTAYVVSVTAGPDTIYMADMDLFAKPMTNGYLYTFENSGLSSSNAYAATYAMPDSPTPASVFRDVEFIPDESAEFIPEDAAGELDGNTIYTNQVPNNYDDGSSGWRNAYGTKFGTTVAGKITKVRLYTSAEESGEHLVSIWNFDTNTLISEQIYSWNIVAGYEGWREFTLPTPVSIVPGTAYVVSVTAGPDCKYVWGSDVVAQPFTNGYLYTFENSGLYSSNAYAFSYTMPDAASSATTFRDVVFVPDDEPVLTTSKPITEISITTYGRTYYDNDALNFNWTMSGFAFEVDGTDAYANFSITKNDNRNVYVNVYVDGATEPYKTLCLTENGDYELAKGLSSGKHTIKVVKRSEAQVGTVAVNSLASSGTITDTPPEKGDYTIEFIGDSITAGYGNLITSGGSTILNTAEQDGTNTYATIAANKLGAEVRVIAASGIGCKFIGNGPDCVMQDIYPYVDGLNYNTTTKFDFANNSADVVVIGLGTNDVGHGTSAEIIASAEEMITLVREYNPNAIIIWAYGMMINAEADLFKQAVANINAKGDKNVYYFQLPLMDTTTEGTGSGGHPSMATHERAGEALANFISGLNSTPETTEGNTIYTNQIPDYYGDGGGWRNAYGTKFGTTVSGKITKVRFYSSANESGEHLVSIWNYDTGELLTEEIYSWDIEAGYEGWREFTLPTAVSIQPGTAYVVSVTAGPDCIYLAGLDVLAQPFTNGYLYTFENSGLYSSNAYAATFSMPDAPSSATTFRDVVFVPDN